MVKPHCIQFGQGDRDLVMLHGWGFNSQVWRCIIPGLSRHFRLHLVDLPGYGNSRTCTQYDLASMVAAVATVTPRGAILLGWSLGGLVASGLALRAPQNFSALITVASSPCFLAQAAWPGIQPAVLTTFYQQLDTDYQATIDRFITLQALGSAHAKQDIQHLKQTRLSQPACATEALKAGLAILRDTDLRAQLVDLPLPYLRIYGALDRLVPRQVSDLLDKLLPASQSTILRHAAHAPFISHPALFCQQIIAFETE